MSQKVSSKRISQIFGPKFRRDALARLQRRMVFKADESRVSDDEISGIISGLLTIGYFPQIFRRNGELLVRVVPQNGAEKRPAVWINGLLFLLTVFTTMKAGALMAGVFHLGWDYYLDFSHLLVGWKYAFGVLLILTTHEMGHYLSARHHRMKVTLPYYIPLPLPGFHFGTLGAFIKIKSPIPNKAALLDVGAAGPLAGFIMSLIFLTIGYVQLPDLQGIIAHVEKIHPWNMGDEGVNLVLGKSLLFAFFNDVLAGGRLPMNEIYHFPFIFAGWIGLLVTAINLIPIGQLDGGHILYSLVGKSARRVGILSFVLLLILNFVLIFRFFSFVWVLWIILIFLLIGFKHPPTVDEHVQLNRTRRITGWFSLGIFILCFSPLPIYLA